MQDSVWLQRGIEAAIEPSSIVAGRYGVSAQAIRMSTLKARKRIGPRAWDEAVGLLCTLTSRRRVIERALEIIRAGEEK